MNLKEAFRYQNFLDRLMQSASSYLSQRDHCLTTTRTHLRAKVNPDAVDEVETVEPETKLKADDVVDFVGWLVEQRNRLSNAIGAAKASIPFDLDAAIETNKFRQSMHGALRSMMRYSPAERIEAGRSYKFNVEGNQMAYVYDIKVVTTDAYDREKTKSLMRSVIAEADRVSVMIDTAMINTEVVYTACLDVNDSFEDAMEFFVISQDQPA